MKQVMMEPGPAPLACTVEVARKGVWGVAPALQLGTERVVLEGGYLKLASVHEEEWTPGEVEQPEAWIRALRHERVGGAYADIFTFSQKLPNTERKFAYPVEWSSVAAISGGYRAWWDGLPQEARKNVRRAQKRGVTLCVKEKLDDDLVRGIMGVNNDSPSRQGREFAHFGKSFEQVWKDQSSFVDRSAFLCAYLGEELIGFIKLVRCGASAAILQILPKASHQDKRPANALIARAVQLCDEEGIPYLVYGLLNYGNKRQGSLREFKLRTGFREILVPRYYAPLTAKGAVAVRLGLHRGAIGILPPRAIAVGVALRARWYNLKQNFRPV